MIESSSSFRYTNLVSAQSSIHTINAIFMTKIYTNVYKNVYIRIKCDYDCVCVRDTFFLFFGFACVCIMIHVSVNYVKVNEKLAPHAKSIGSSLEARKKHHSTIKVLSWFFIRTQNMHTRTKRIVAIFFAIKTIDYRKTAKSKLETAQQIKRKERRKQK